MTDIRKERLYYDQSELFEFEAKVVEQVQEEGNWLVRLDKTAFYPTSGGQPNDTGWLNQSRVLDVFVLDGHVYHVVDSPCNVGESVTGKIDIPRRIDHMQQHAGQHIVSACFEQLCEIDTVGFHLGDELATIDLDTFSLTEEIIRVVEEKANQIVLEDRRITPVFVSQEDLPSLHLRHAPKVKENIRIVQIEGFDHNACGGTHPSSTGKVGQIKFLKTERARNGIRLWFVCGGRALREHENDLAVIQQLGKMFSTGRDGLVEAARRQFVTIREQRKWHAEMENRFAAMEGKEFYIHSERIEDCLVCCSGIEHTSEAGYLKSVIKAYESSAKGQPFLIALVAGIENRIFVQAASSGSVSIGADEWILPVIKEFEGKGGGNGRAAQGSIPIPTQAANTQMIEQVLQYLKASIVRH